MYITFDSFFSGEEKVKVKRHLYFPRGSRAFCPCYCSGNQADLWGLWPGARLWYSDSRGWRGGRRSEDRLPCVSNTFIWNGPHHSSFLLLLNWLPALLSLVSCRFSFHHLESQQWIENRSSQHVVSRLSLQCKKKENENCRPNFISMFPNWVS